MDFYLYGIRAAVIALGVLFSVRLWSTTGDRSTVAIHKNMGLINFFCFVHLFVISTLRFVQFDPQEWAYQFLFRLNSTLLVVLTAAAYYIYKIPFFGDGEIRPFWRKNPYAGSNRPGFLDPANKVESDVEIRLKGDREAIFRSLETQEIGFIRSKEAPQRLHGQPRPSSDNINRAGYMAYDYLEYVKYRRPPAPEVPLPIPGVPVVGGPALPGGGSSITPASDIKEVIWWAEDNRLRCYNTFTEVPGPDAIPQVEGAPSLSAHPSAIFTNCVSVVHPEQITPAINLIKQTLGHMPYYTTDEPSRNQFQYSVAVSCKFFTYPNEFYHKSQGAFGGAHPAQKSFRPEGGYGFDADGNIDLDYDPERPNLVPVDEDVHLVSCISVSVDKILVVNFHLLHMIRGIQTDLALEQVTRFFTDFILEPSIVKFWFNPQSDIKVMDSTLEELYRGTPRRPFRGRVIPGTGPPSVMLEYNPRYKLQPGGDQVALFGKVRPENTSFGGDARWGTRCPYGFHTNTVDLSQRPCPCRTNNLDLAVVTEFIMRNIGLEPPMDGNPYNRRAWTGVRNEGNFNDFVKCLLHGDKHEGLLLILRDVSLPPVAPGYIAGDCTGRCGQVVGVDCADDCPNKELWKRSISDARDRFFRRFANPNFQQSHDLLGYAAGDVISIAMVVRFLMTTQHPRLLLERLRLWNIKPRGPMGEVAFTRAPESDTSLVLQRFDISWNQGSNLVQSVPLYIENKAFAQEDLIEWVKDRVLVRSIHPSGSKAAFLRPETLAWEFLFAFMQGLPRALGEYVIEEVVSKPQRNSGSTQYRQSDRQFTINEIREIFNAPSKHLMASQLLQMMIAYLELKLIHEYENDRQRVGTMDRQFEASRLTIGPLLGALDNEVIMRAKRALIDPPHQPGWISRHPDLLRNTLMDVNKTASGLFLKPTQPIDFPDDFRRGGRRIRDLIDNLLDLQELNAHRVEEFRRLMNTMVDVPNKETLENATLHEVTHFRFPYLEILEPSRGRGMDTTNLVNNGAIISFWIFLVFKITNDGAGIRSRSELLAQRVFELTFSPTNFYMPELHHVIKRTAPTDLYKQARLIRRRMEVRESLGARTDGGTQGPPDGNQDKGGGGVSVEVEGEPEVVAEEPRVVEGAELLRPINLPGYLERDQAQYHEERTLSDGELSEVASGPGPAGNALYMDSIRFDIDQEGFHTEPVDAGAPISDEQAQFLRVLRNTIETWCSY